uniref:Uncharacterized protein n=1 Tax=Ditylum brightwellii TaxID=49249 RepID=A0A7S4SJQ2_9STRA
MQRVGVGQILDDVGVLMAKKIFQLSIGCQHAMKLLACMGSKCSESILKLFIHEGEANQQDWQNTKKRKTNYDSNDRFSMLDFTVDEGLIKKRRAKLYVCA